MRYRVHPIESPEATAFEVTDDLIAYTDHLELRVGGKCVGAVGWSTAHGWWAAIETNAGLTTLDRSSSEVQAKQRVNAVMGHGRWVRVDSLHDVSW